MRAFLVSAVGSVLGVVVIAQAQAPVTPPLIPQPGITTGATGGIGQSAFGAQRGITGGVPTNLTGRSAFTPVPVLMPPNTIGPEFFDPLAAEGTLMPPLEAPGAVDTSQGSPAGLGVTITGGSTNPPSRSRRPRRMQRVET